VSRLRLYKSQSCPDFREDLKEKYIQTLRGLVKRPKTNKKEVWKSLAQPTEEKKEEEVIHYFRPTQRNTQTAEYSEFVSRSLYAELKS